MWVLSNIRQRLAYTRPGRDETSEEQDAKGSLRVLAFFAGAALRAYDEHLEGSFNAVDSDRKSSLMSFGQLS
jgi:hypothetical protein